MKLKDIFKVALVGTAGWIGGSVAGPTGRKIGTALGASLMGSSGATERVPGAENAAQLNSDWEYRLNRYLVRRKYFEDIA